MPEKRAGEPIDLGPPRDWVEGCASAQQRLGKSLAVVDDETARRPSRLPGWTVGHTLTHVARNADSVVWRLAGAAAGEVRDQYPGGLARRAADIEGGAGRSATELVDDVRQTSEAVARIMRTLPDRAWEALSRNSRGVAESSRLVVLSRWREVVLHHADLGITEVEPPEGLVTACLDQDVPQLAQRTNARQLWYWILGRGDPPVLRPWESSRSAPPGSDAGLPEPQE